MQISLNWLNDYVSIGDLAPEEIARVLTDLGLAVDAITVVSPFGAGLVIGKVLEAVQHPNADTLRLCKVDVGVKDPLAIVCGAPNARAGITVAVATVGTELPGGFKIKEAKIRGEKSMGMLCSESELGLSENHDGIIELDGKFSAGSSAAVALGKADTVLTLDLTPNRADCLSHVGVARDLAARLKRPLTLPGGKPKLSSSLKTKDHVTVKVADADVCPRFCALYIKNVAAVPSPAWLQRRLEAAGMRPINLVVDATNYVMLEYGQPIHAYDERDVAGRVLEARLAQAGEALMTLDGQERKLSGGEILICDGQRPIGLAGIMGGKDSEIKPDTKNMIVEVAYFPSLTIRKVSKRLAIRSEASQRFERGVNIDALARVAWRVADVLQKATQELIAAGQSLPEPEVAADLIDLYPRPVEAPVIALRLARVRDLLGLPKLSKEMAAEALAALGIVMIDSTQERMVFEIPHWRRDIEREVDLIEEIGRIMGYDKIPYQLPQMSLLTTPEDGFVDFCEDARVAMAQIGYRETITFPFWSASDIEALGLDGDHPLRPSLMLQNPLSEDQGMMQTSLVASLMRAAATNLRHGKQGVRLFECGRGYYDFTQVKIDKAKYTLWSSLDRAPRHFTRRAQEDKQRPLERHVIAGLLGQPFSPKSWNLEERPAGFFHAKETVMSWLKSFGVFQPVFERFAAADLPFLHPNASAIVKVDGQVLGYLGEIHPKTALAYGLSADDTPVFFELDLEAVFDLRAKGLTIDTKLFRFPPASRDLAVVVSGTTTHADFEAAFAKFPKKRTLVRAKLFDVYTGESIPAGKKSMAYSFEFQSADRTLTDQEVETELGALVSWLSQTLGAEQR